MKTLSLSQVETLLAKLYREQDLTVDHLPYTDQFNAMFELVHDQAEAPLDEHQVWEMLIYLRKAGRLDNKDKPRSSGEKARPTHGGLLGLLK